MTYSEGRPSGNWLQPICCRLPWATFENDLEPEKVLDGVVVLARDFGCAVQVWERGRLSYTVQPDGTFEKP